MAISAIGFKVPFNSAASPEIQKAENLPPENFVGRASICDEDDICSFYRVFVDPGDQTTVIEVQLPFSPYTIYPATGTFAWVSGQRYVYNLEFSAPNVNAQYTGPLTYIF